MGWIDPREIQLGGKLGRGSFKTIYYGTYENKPVAVGMLNYDVSQSDFEREIYFLKILNHKNIIDFVGICYHNRRCCIITEYCDHKSLLDFMKKNNGTGLKDLKSDNILIKSSNTECITAKISDFGVARISHIEAMMSTRGAPNWKAPEILARHIDIYSAGLVFWEIFTWGKEGFPYSNFVTNNENDLYRLVIQGNRPSIDPLIRNNIGSSIINLIQSMWRTEPERRPSIGSIVTTLSTLR
ncbi:17984_t:CDS:2, partial [Acaulospora morrowiae]